MLPKLVVVHDPAWGVIIEFHLLVFRGELRILLPLDGFLVLEALVDANVGLSIGVFLMITLIFY